MALAALQERGLRDLAEVVAHALQPKELGRLACVSPFYARLVRELKWDEMCDAIWEAKVYVPRELRELRARGESLLALRRSAEDAARTHIRDEELTMFLWNYRLKESCGPVRLRQASSLPPALSRPPACRRRY